MATQTAYDDVTITWTAPSTPTQTAFDDVKITWLSGNVQSAYDDVVISWLKTPYTFYLWDGVMLLTCRVGVWDGSTIQWIFS